MTFPTIAKMSLAFAFTLLSAGLVFGAAADYPNGDYVIGPDYTPAPEVAGPLGPLRGTVHPFTMLAADSKFYPGIRHKVGLARERTPTGEPANVPFDVASQNAPYYPRHVEVYIPPGYKRGTPAPFMVVLDGVWVNRVHDTVLQAVDAMIAAKRLPPMILVLIDPGNRPVEPTARTGPDSPTEDGPGSERSMEFDTVSSRFGDFVQAEVLPRVEKDYHVKLTGNPDGRAVYGISSSGVAAFNMAWFHPERYRRVMIYSGTFINNQSPVDPQLPLGAWEYHDHLIAEAPKKPIRIWMSVGERDNSYTATEESHRNWVIANTRMAAVLKNKGYDYRFIFAKGAEHVDNRVVGQTLPEALEYIWKGYPIH